MGKFLCDGCDNDRGTYRTEHAPRDEEGSSMAVDYVVCAKRGVMRRVEEGGPFGCLDRRRRGEEMIDAMKVLRLAPRHESAFYESLIAIEVEGIRFSREPQEYDWELENGRIKAIVLDGARFVNEKDVRSDMAKADEERKELFRFVFRMHGLLGDAVALSRTILDNVPAEHIPIDYLRGMNEVYAGLIDLDIDSFGIDEADEGRQEKPRFIIPADLCG